MQVTPAKFPYGYPFHLRSRPHDAPNFPLHLQHFTAFDHLSPCDSSCRFFFAITYFLPWRGSFSFSPTTVVSKEETLLSRPLECGVRQDKKERGGRGQICPRQRPLRDAHLYTDTRHLDFWTAVPGPRCERRDRRGSLCVCCIYKLPGPLVGR